MTEVRATLPFPILFEDVHLIVLSKPAGLLSQGEHTGDENLVDILRKYFGRNYVGLVHRLDRNTSGIMIVAKRSKAADRLTQSLQKGQLKRSYLAWLEGHVPAGGSSGDESSWQHWEDWLLRDEKTKVTRVVSRSNRSAQQALLRMRPLRETLFGAQPITLCEFELETGRSHQIRAQSASRRHPLLGDRKYGARLDFPRTALHSHRLEVPHPMSGEWLRLECPLPADLDL